jgi:indolepyruvate ferredoxin oxidoreductase
LWQAQQLLEAHDICFQPGVNEDLAATAVWGSQQVGLFPGAKVAGVFGIWYGKGLGVDCSADALRHANWAGTSPHGGVLAVAGDDHGAQSSTTAHQSEQVFGAAMMPILAPATVQEILDLGLIGFALSRFSGCWVGFKMTSETVETSATVDVDPQHPLVSLPRDFEMPPGGLHIRWPHGGMDWALEQERRLHGAKMAAVGAFARANGIDRVVIDSPRPRLGLIAAGKAYLDLRQALSELGISDAIAAELGIRVYKVGLLGRSCQKARAASPKGLATFSSLKKSAVSLSRSSCAFSTMWMHRGGRALSARPTRAERRFCPAPANLPRPWRREHSCRDCSALRTCRSLRSALHGLNLSSAWALRRVQMFRALRSFARVARTALRLASRKGAAPWQGSVATAWLCSCPIAPPQRSPIWAAKA